MSKSLFDAEYVALERLTTELDDAAAEALRLLVRGRLPSRQCGARESLRPLALDFVNALKERTEQFGRELTEIGTPDNTRRAYEADLRYFWFWFCLRYPESTDSAPHYPVSRALVAAFLLDHMGYMDPAVESALNTALVADTRDRQHRVKAYAGPLKPATLRRRVAALSRMHRELRMESPTRDPCIALLLRLYELTLADWVKAEPNSADAQRLAVVSKKTAADARVLDLLLATCDQSLRGVRDRAILSVGFWSGGRRRSELAAMDMSRLQETGEGYVIDIGITNPDRAGAESLKPVTGSAAEALRAWLQRTKIKEGPVFRGIQGRVTLRRGISGRSIATMIKERARAAGLDPATFGGHSLRAGFMTQAALAQDAGVSRTMALSGHHSMQAVLGYFPTLRRNLKDSDGEHGH